MPQELPHVRQAREVELLKQHVAHFDQSGDATRAGAARAELKNTSDRLEHSSAAAAVVEQLGLGDEVNATSVTRADAINYLAKVRHEIAQGVKVSHYARTHASVAKLPEHHDAERLKAPWDPAAEAVEHLGLSKPEHIAAATAFFGKGV